VIKINNKKDILANLVNIPKTQKRAFWSREFKLLNDLIEIFPNEKFWNLISMSEKKDSLLFYKSDHGIKILKKLYNEFNYIPKTTPKIDLGEKFGEDKVIKYNNKTIKNFLS
tara:strand:+ start:373 stop:708 length:336 start_codon:yes stop_codon:yes gene_type:complete